MMTVKLPSALVLFAAVCSATWSGLSAAQAVPLPRPRQTSTPAPEGMAEEGATPSACRLRLTADLAVAPSLPAPTGSGECSVEDAVRLEAVWLADKTRVAVTPPAIVRCLFAEAIV